MCFVLLAVEILSGRGDLLVLVLVLVVDPPARTTTRRRTRTKVWFRLRRAVYFVVASRDKEDFHIKAQCSQRISDILDCRPWVFGVVPFVVEHWKPAFRYLSFSTGNNLVRTSSRSTGAFWSRGTFCHGGRHAHATSSASRLPNDPRSRDRRSIGQRLRCRREPGRDAATENYCFR